MKTIAILGASGYIGLSLTSEFLKQEDLVVYLFSRNPESLEKKVAAIESRASYTVDIIDNFHNNIYDVVINCTGIGDPSLLKKDQKEILHITEGVDTNILSYLLRYSKTIYINMSSGAVYGDTFDNPVTEVTKTTCSNSFTSPYDFYVLSKLYAEANHRLLSHLNIVDLRVFAFFSSFVDSKTSFFMSEIVRCLQSGEVFVTSESPMIRDYITSCDLYLLVRCIMSQETINDYFDVYSKQYVSKNELLSFLEKKYGLQYHVKKDSLVVSTSKSKYYSESKKASLVLGYEPTFSSLEGIDRELSLLLLRNK